MREKKDKRYQPVLIIQPKRTSLVYGTIWGIIIVCLIALVIITTFEKQFKNKIYPNVSVGGITFGGKTPKEVERFWLEENAPFASTRFELTFGNSIATISGAELDLGFDATLSATQAYMVGRSGHLGSDIIAKFFQKNTDMTPLFRWRTEALDETLESLGSSIDIPVQEALFNFQDGKVTAFRPSKEGRKLNGEEAKKIFVNTVALVPTKRNTLYRIKLPVETVKPFTTTDESNVFGIKELIGRGYSEFSGSIPGRIHNVALAASKLHGVLIKPGDTFSFNDAVGDISVNTGFQPAYIIKEGRTVLGDGGGVCQVSTTLFRAALDAGLDIIERTAHAYRVHYYEEGGYKPGLDATVFAPTVDLKIKNDTAGYILIQTKTDTRNLTLTFELYGTSDGRISEILRHVILSQTPPPPDLFQDDPTLPKGMVKQVDFSAWGAKTSFQYRVTRAGVTLQDRTFISNFRPWQAVYLRGTKE